MKKNLVVLLCAIMLLSTFLTACGSNEGNTGNSAPANSANGDKEEAPEKSQEPLKISIMADLHTAELPDEMVLKELEKNTNTVLDITWVPDDNYDEKMNTAIATGSLPQAMFIKNQSSFILLKDSIRQGAFWEVGPLLKDFPHLAALNQDVYHNTSVDGKIYSLYQERPLSRQGVIYRQDWAEKLGLSEPKSTDDLLNMMKAFTEQDPDGNGAKDTIGLTDRSDLVYGAFKTLSSYFGTPNNWGEVDGKLVPEFMTPAYMETMKYMKNLRDKGYINKDFPVTSKKDQQNMFITGKAGMYIGSMQDVKDLNEKAIKINPNLKFNVVNRIAGPDGQDHGIWSIAGFGSLVFFPKSTVKTEDDLKQILTFFDYVASAEGYNLLHYGLEGTTYNIKDGKADPVADPALQNRAVKPYQALEIGGEISIEGALKGLYAYDMKVKADELVIDNNSRLIADPTAPYDSKTFAEKGKQLDQVIIDAVYKFILGNIDEKGFQAEIENWKSQGGDQVIQEFNDAYKK